MDEKRECGRALPRDHRITWSDCIEPETPPGPTTQCPVCETRLAVLGDLKRFGAATETVTMHLPFCSGRPAKVR